MSALFGSPLVSDVVNADPAATGKLRLWAHAQRKPCPIHLTKQTTTQRSMMMTLRRQEISFMTWSARPQKKSTMTAATATIRSAVIIAVLLVSAGAFSPRHVATRNRFNVNLYATTQESGTSQSTCCSRRSFWHQSASLAVSAGAVLMGNTPSVLAAGLSQEDVDKQRIKKGYERLTYLLDNWEAETSICNTGTDKQFTGCERTPMKVMEVRQETTGWRQFEHHKSCT